jgi:hypothetical protein
MSIVLQSSGGGSVTIAEPATASNFTQTLPATTGTIALTSQLPVAGPAFYAYSPTGSQSVSNASYTKVLFPTEVFDTNSNFASSRFTPTVAGYYQLSTMVAWLSGSANVVFLELFKNGSLLSHLTRMSKTAQYIWQPGSTIAYANGTSDYFEIYAYQDSGSSMSIDSGEGYTWFAGALIRSA